MERSEAQRLVGNHTLTIGQYQGVSHDCAKKLLGQHRFEKILADPIRGQGPAEKYIYPWNVVDYLCMKIEKPPEPEARQAAPPTTYDDPNWDGTDAAHPAFWRGQDDGVRGACRIIRDDLKKGSLSGHVASQELQAIREEINHLQSRLRFYKTRVDALNERFRDWPEPANTEAYNILANGTHSAMARAENDGCPSRCTHGVALAEFCWRCQDIANGHRSERTQP